MPAQRPYWLLATLPPIGFIASRDGQPFEVTAHEPYMRKDGTVTSLVEWTAPCATCGDLFSTITSIGVWPGTRRCEDHREALRKVTKAELRASGILPAEDESPAKPRKPKSPQRSYLDRARRLAAVDDASDLI